MSRLVVLAVAVLALAACGGDEGLPEPPEAPETTMPEPGTTEAAPPTATTGAETTTEQEETPPPPPPPDALPGLPGWTAGYREWTKLNAAAIPPRDPDPHLGTKNVYASRDMLRNAYPPGTVIVKEARRPGADFVGLVAGMRKVPGANPDHNDWVFVEWTRDSRDAPFTELARGAVCESCHSGVAGQDYVFTTG